MFEVASQIQSLRCILVKYNTYNDEPARINTDTYSSVISGRSEKSEDNYTIKVLKEIL